MIALRKHKRKSGGATFYGRSGPYGYAHFHAHGDVYDLIHAGHDVKLVECDEGKELLGILSTMSGVQTGGITLDRTIKGDTKLLNRIIRGGGMIEYIQTLEGKL